LERQPDTLHSNECSTNANSLSLGNAEGFIGGQINYRSVALLDRQRAVFDPSYTPSMLRPA